MAEQDTGWKEIITDYLKEFLDFFYTEAHNDIDWSKKPEFLDKELAQIMPDGEVGLRLADKLVKVFLLNGMEKWVLIHIEVQGYYDADFAERMFVYSNRIFDLHRKFVASLVIFTDIQQNFKPRRFHHKLWESEQLLRYRVVKLLDYRKDWQALENNPNPFSLVVMAYLKMRELGTARQNELAVWKLELNKMLYRRGYSKRWITGFYTAINWLIRLPDELEDNFWFQLKEYVEQEVDITMPFITAGERINRREGRQEGLHEGALNVTLRLVEHRFGPLAPDVAQTLRELSLARLEDLSVALLDFKNKTELTVWLEGQH